MVIFDFASMSPKVEGNFNWYFMNGHQNLQGGQKSDNIKLHVANGY